MLLVVSRSKGETEISLSLCAPENLTSPDGFGRLRPLPRQSTHSPHPRRVSELLLLLRVFLLCEIRECLCTGGMLLRG